MIRNYFKIALRNLWKHKLFSFINIFGLAAGIMVCLVALTHIKGAYDYDDFHPNRERIYRVLTDVTDQGNNRSLFASSPIPLAGELKSGYDFVESTARVIRHYGEIDVSHKRFNNLLLRAVDPSFFSIFGFKLRQGQYATEPKTAVLSPKTAERLFGKASPIGQTLQHSSLGAFTVVGVVDDAFNQSHLRFDLLVAMPPASFTEQSANDWRDYRTAYTYVLLKPGTPADLLQKAVTSVSNRVTQGLQLHPANRPNEGDKDYTFLTQALTNFSPARQQLYNGTHEPDRIALTIEMGVCLLTLLLAGFNYVNLTLARSLSRAREVGIRKVVGALRWQLMGQFMAESLILSLFSLGLSYAMLQIVKPMAAIQQWFIGGVREDGRLWLIFIAFSLFTGLVAGLIPARVLSGFQPAMVLRSQTGLRVLRGISLRKSLIVIQFALTLTAVILLVTMTRQQRYMANADYGFRRDGVLNIPLHDVPVQRLANELAKISGVEGVSPLSIMLGDHGGDGAIVRRQRSADDSSASFVIAADAGFVPTMQLTLAAGQNLPQTHTDSASRLVLINEEAVRKFGLDDARAAVGQTIWLNNNEEVQVAGVLKDFQYTTFAWSIKPLIVRYSPDRFRYVNVAVARGSEENVLAATRQIWKQLHRYGSFDGQWYDTYLEDRHGHYEDLHVLLLLIGLALSIACLGLLGMVIYTTETRIKEIGIRKVMGAQVSQISWLLSWDFVRLLIIAGVIALPSGYFIGNFFIRNFAYHVDIGFETLGLCFGLMLIIGSLTIGIKTYRAAQANPADSLRSE
ncbi:ABC transporter permease [Tellurirhabdus bombi]|uniref:ABC transporter permease n=1 Tax=Tellurirhabdus bombi TaxID=2907205 RepID=UPI001F29E79D|nr:ABC transporter permease [Tellurirhabdus bombi]